MLLDRVVRTSAAVAAAPGRLAKIELIAGLLREVPPSEIVVAVSFLSGELTQRQIGVGYAALTEPGPLAAEPDEPVLSLTDTDQVLGQIGASAGAGSPSSSRPFSGSPSTISGASRPVTESSPFSCSRSG